MSRVGVWRFQGPTVLDKIRAAYTEGVEKSTVLTNFNYVIYCDIVAEWKRFLTQNKEKHPWLQNLMPDPIDRKLLILAASEEDKQYTLSKSSGDAPCIEVEMDVEQKKVRILWKMFPKQKEGLVRSVVVEIFNDDEELPIASMYTTIDHDLEDLVKYYEDYQEGQDSEEEEEEESLVWITKYE